MTVPCNEDTAYFTSTWYLVLPAMKAGDEASVSEVRAFVLARVAEEPAELMVLARVADEPAELTEVSMDAVSWSLFLDNVPRKCGGIESSR